MLRLVFYAEHWKVEVQELSLYSVVEIRASISTLYMFLLASSVAFTLRVFIVRKHSLPNNCEISLYWEISGGAREKVNISRNFCALPR